jgi:hypothetical protein
MLLPFLKIMGGVESSGCRANKNSVWLLSPDDFYLLVDFVFSEDGEFEYCQRLLCKSQKTNV